MFRVFFNRFTLQDQTNLKILLLTFLPSLSRQFENTTATRHVKFNISPVSFHILIITHRPSQRSLAAYFCISLVVFLFSIFFFSLSLQIIDAGGSCITQKSWLVHCQTLGTRCHFTPCAVFILGGGPYTVPRLGSKNLNELNFSRFYQKNRILLPDLELK